MKRDDVISKAAELINGARATDYGDPVESFTRLAMIWSAILGVEVTASQVALCLAGLKMARLAHTPSHADSWVDLVGYAALGGEISGSDVVSS